MWAAGPGNYCGCFELIIRFVLSDAIYTDKLLSVPAAEIHTVDLNREPLPYSDNRFALVTLHRNGLALGKLSRGRPGNLPAAVSSGISVAHRSLHATNWIVYHRDKRTYGTLDERNAWAVRAMNSPDLLLGRTLIVTAVKPV